MKLLLQTRTYWPKLGGIETVARLLAREFRAAGHETVVLTETPGAAEEDGIAALRRASLPQRVAALKAADAVLLLGMSLRFLPLPLLLRRRTLVSHQTWYGTGATASLKRAASRLTRNIAASRAIAEALGAPATVIPNPYDDRLFFERRDLERDRELVFVGRLVPDKGLLLLIEALAQLARDRLHPTLVIIGSGPQEPAVRAAAAAAGVDRQIEWVGPMWGEKLACTLSRHRVLVVPSLWNEPFGIVALEGAACGCTVVGSNGGGLPEAIGPCGRTFPNGDATALAQALRAALAGTTSPPVATVREHLRRHAPSEVARHYLDVFQEFAE